MIRGFRDLGSNWDAEQLGAPWGDRRAILDIVREYLSQDRESGGSESEAPVLGFAPPEPASSRQSADRQSPLAAEALPAMPALPGSSDEALLWVPGARDGIFGGEVEDGETAAQAARIFTTLRRVIVLGGVDRAAELYRLLVDVDAVSCVDSLLTLVIEDDRLAGHWARERLREIALWLVRGAPDPEPVKIGLALFGLCAEREDLEVLNDLGAHEELTLYTAVAIDNAFVDSDPLLWDLAQQVHGWGRIQAVERLSETRDPTVQAWLVREGFRNSISNGYLALTCADAGDLAGRLAGEEIDDELLIGASGILLALCDAQGTAETLQYYSDAKALVERFIVHLQAWRPEIPFDRPIGRAVEPILAAAALRRFLAGGEDGEQESSQEIPSIGLRKALELSEAEGSAEVSEPAEFEWDEETNERFRQQLGELLSSQRWRRIARAALDQTALGQPALDQTVRRACESSAPTESDEAGPASAPADQIVDDDFDLAEAAARVVGLDTWELHLERVRYGSRWDAPASWTRLFTTEDPDRLERAVRLAEKRFGRVDPSPEGGSDEDWSGKDRVSSPAIEDELHAILQALERHPGLSWPLITRGLDGKSLSLRVVAARALGVWPRDSWPIQGEFLLRRAFRGETSGEVRGLLHQLLAG